MPINWTRLETEIREYMQKGAAEPKRTPIQVAMKIEKLYISEVKQSGADPFGNKVLNLPAGLLAATLVAKFNSNIGAIPTLDPNKMLEERLNTIKKDPPPIPSLPGEKPTEVVTTNAGMRFAKSKTPPISVSIPKLPLPGVPVVPNISLKIPMLISKESAENDVRKRMKPPLPEIPVPPTVPIVSVSDLTALVKTPKMPPIPNPAAVTSKVSAAVKSIYAYKTPKYSPTVKPLLPQVPTIPSTPSLSELGIKIPTLPVDSKLISMNVAGINGILLTWRLAQMGILGRPPGVAVVAANQITSPGSFVPMACALGGPDFSSEIVKSLKIHSKTISGLIIGTTPNGAPIAVPWVGIS